MYIEETARLALYAPEEFGRSSKTAEGVLRYGKNPVTCVIDPSQAGRTIASVVGINVNAPIVATVAEALKLGADALLLGTAWNGGRMPDNWRADIVKAISGGMDIINGLHDFLEEDENILAAARAHGKRLFDVRKSPGDLPVAAGRVLADEKTCVILTALEIQRAAAKDGEEKTAFVATGQTGIMICGRGIAIDRVIGDFMAGATEAMVVEAAAKADYVFVEGQGSLAHPGFSGVTLALLHGACPQGMILCHKPSRHKIKNTEIAVSDLNKLIATYESMTTYLRPGKVLAIALNTSDLSLAEAEEAIKICQNHTGLPTCDPVRFSADILWQTIKNYHSISTVNPRSTSENRR